MLKKWCSSKAVELVKIFEKNEINQVNLYINGYLRLKSHNWIELEWDRMG